MVTNRFLRGLDAAELQSLEAYLRPVTYRVGERLVAEGTPNDKLLLIDAGAVRLYRTRADAQRQSFHEVGPGEFLGEMSVLDGQAAPFEAVAVAAVEARALAQTELLRIVAGDTPVAAKLLRNLLGVVLERARDTDERLSLYAGSVAMLRRYN